MLLIDLDPQASLTAALGIDETTLERSLYNVLTGECELGDILVAAMTSPSPRQALTSPRPSSSL